MKELLKLDTDEFILRLPETYLRFSEGGRLDFPGRMVMCQGNGWIGENCNVCLHHYLFLQRTYGTQPEDLDNDIVRPECMVTGGKIPVVSKNIAELLKRRIDKLEESDYKNYVLPIIKKLYIALIIEEEKSK